VLERANRGGFTGTTDEKWAEAEKAFDQSALEMYERSHPLIRLKFPTPDRLPYYYLQRELAALLAVKVEGHSVEGSGAGNGGRAERWFESEDGLLGGKPDFLDAAHHEVVDYKTGHVDEDIGDMVGERERRQLALYAYLANESGFDIEAGRIIRANGMQAVVPISHDEATEQAEAARSALAEYNEAVGTSTFESLADPTPGNCRFCECKPLCEAFWNAASYEWEPECGTHVEGSVVSCSSPRTISGMELVTLEIEPTRGTVFSDGIVTLLQIPVEWFTADGDEPPREGDLIRLVDGQLVKVTEDGQERPAEPLTIRGNRIKTTVWRVQPGVTPPGEVE
jgi:CRISPR/Cas system-associated exonuclease Cas4 (RecB family)